MFALLDVDGGGNIVAPGYARNAKSAGLDIITWTLERSGVLADGNNGFYYQTIDSAIKREGDTMDTRKCWICWPRMSAYSASSATGRRPPLNYGRCINPKSFAKQAGAGSRTCLRSGK
ncbi:MAG: hypothetical protein ACYCZJ_13980 [Sulfuriferula sp.]